MFGIGGFELFLILIFAFLIFGPDKLPEIAKTIGKGIAKFRNAQEDMTEQLKTASFIDKDNPDSPLKNPLEVVEGAANEATAKAKDARQKASEATDKVIEHTESFAERKARYDRERAKRKEAEQKAAAEEAERAKAAEEAAREARENPKADVGAKAVVEEGD